jgi:multiple sugar transport system permease protein
MSLIAQVGRRSLGPRLWFGAVYAALTLGAVTMVYPFLLMAGNSATTSYDWWRFRVVPRYLWNRLDLLCKYTVDKDGLVLYGERYAKNGITFTTIRPAHFAWLLDLPPGACAARAADLAQFTREACPERFLYPAFSWQTQKFYSPLWLRSRYVAWLQAKHGSLDALNRAHGYPYRRWEDVATRGVLNPIQHARTRADEPHAQDLFGFLLASRQEHPEWVSLVSADEVFQAYLAGRYGTIERFNRKNGTAHKDFTEARLGSAHGKPELALELEEAEPLRQRPVEFFLRRLLPLHFYRLDPSARPAWERFLARGRLSPSKNPFSELAPPGQERAATWIEFIHEAAPLAAIRVDDPVTHWRGFLRRKYADDLAALNRAHGAAYASWEEVVRLPVAEMDWTTVDASAGRLRARYLLGNYAEVLKLMATHGRALANTLLYVALAVAGALTVNPLAAYALARFRMAHANKVLVFLLATMAFPAEVAMIPGFLLVRDLGLLNTFGALVLPTLASGYSIFLLKGFFESLPPELYEAGLLDGASEARMFWNITLPLSKPILAVIALGAFSSAYGAFIFAFLTCQDPSMWTLMVFLYQFQQESSNGLIMASLVVAALPTLTVFALCQRVILRGIAIPTFK